MMKLLPDQDDSARDAVIVTVIRRNPFLSMGIATVSFSSVESVNVFSLLLILGAWSWMNDLCVSVPAALTMRQLRYGHPCKKAEDEKEESEQAPETSSQQVEEEGAEGGADLEKALD